MTSLERVLQKELTPELKKEFRKYCLLLQGYSDNNNWTYECDFSLTDNIYWNDLVFYTAASHGVEMLKYIKEFFEKVVKYYIDIDELWEHIERYPETLIETGWLHFTIFPTQNKLQIEMTYDYFDNVVTTHEDNISDMVGFISKGDDDNTKIQLSSWKKQGGIFIVKYGGSNLSGYIDDTCISNIGITKTPELIEHLSDLMIETYENSYYLEEEVYEGGEGEIKFDFKTDTVLIEHTQYKTASTEVELAKLNF